MTSDREALLQAIIEHPRDDTPRLMLADSLEEEHPRDVARGEFIRVQVELAKRGFNPGCPKCNNYGGPCDTCEALDVEELRRRERELRQSLCNDLWPPFLGELVVVRTKDGWLIGDNDGNTDPIAALPSRGFISSITISWSDWLAHEASLVWWRGATMECQRCVDGIIFRGSYTGDRCPCNGTRLISRPMPATAQPVERVRLTTHPLGRGDEGEAWHRNVASQSDFFWTEQRDKFVRLKCSECGGAGCSGATIHGVWHDRHDEKCSINCPECHGQPLNEWTCETWPMQVFEMPQQQILATVGGAAHEYDLRGLPLPIVHPDFTFSQRLLEEARRTLPIVPPQGFLHNDVT